MPLRRHGIAGVSPRILPVGIPFVYPPSLPPVAPSCRAMWDFQDGVGKAFDLMRHIPVGGITRDWLTQNQQDLEAGTTTGFIAAAATLTNSAVNPHGGLRCLLVTPDGAASGEGITAPNKYVTYPLAAYGQSWRWKCWCNPPAGETVQFTMYELPGYGSTAVDIVGDGTYQQMTLNRTLSQAATTSIWLMARTTAAGQSAWRMDDFELYRTDITDANASVTGAIGVGGPYGRLLAFDGTDDYGKVLGDCLGLGALSIEALVYLTDWGTGDYPRVITNHKTILAGAVGTPGYFFLSSDGGTTSLYTTASISLSTWYHVVATRTAAGAGIIYLNGVANASGATGTPASGNDTLIGNSQALDRPFAGRMALLRIWNGVLTATEAQACYRFEGGRVNLPVA